MRGSIRLFTTFGISIKIHVTFLLLPLLFGVLYGLKGIFLIFFVFLCVTLHEICHSLAARHYGVKVRDITLFPIGGVAAMRSIPENAGQELIISLAGPLFNFILAALLFFPFYRLLGPEVLLAFPSPVLDTWPRTLAYAYWVNPFLGLFNLLPAFPMDGGRVLRSLLARWMHYQQATRIAVGIGHTFALIFVLFGLANSQLFLAVIGVFIYLAASQEESEVDFRTTLKKYYVRDVLSAGFVGVDPEMPLRRVIELIFHSRQEDFPVLKEGKLVGILTRGDIISTIHREGMEKTAGEAMRTGFPIVRPDDDLVGVQRMMQESELKALPVVSGDGTVVGVITLEDIVRVYFIVGKKT